MRGGGNSDFSSGRLSAFKGPNINRGGGISDFSGRAANIKRAGDGLHFRHCSHGGCLYVSIS